MNVAAFQTFGNSHIAALSVIVAAIGLLHWLAVRGRNRVLSRIEGALGGLLLAIPMVTASTVAWIGPFDFQTALPLHYCDIATIAGGIALLTRRRLAIEFVYFFGLAGTLQGLLTPALQADFPSPRYFHFFVIHGGVVITALHLVWIRGLHPRRGAIGRMMLATAIYTATAAMVNWGLSTNFGFLCGKPPNASLMDHLGPWPWYILSLFGLATLFYTLLDLPFWKERRRSPNSHDMT